VYVLGGSKLYPSFFSRTGNITRIFNGHFHGLKYSSYTLIKIFSKNLPVQHSTCKKWKYSNMVLYHKLFNAYGHRCITKVLSEWWLVGKALYHRFHVLFTGFHRHYISMALYWGLTVAYLPHRSFISTEAKSWSELLPYQNLWSSFLYNGFSLQRFTKLRFY